MLRNLFCDIFQSIHKWLNKSVKNKKNKLTDNEIHNFDQL